MQLCQASPEQVEAIERFLAGSSLREREPGPAKQRPLAGADAGPPYVFRWTGRDWKVVFAGGEPFYLPDTLGAKYLDYLLHHPNEPIGAFDLEVAITPEKGEARSRNSIQPESDAQALREYRRELRRLEAEREEARAEGEQVRAAEIGAEIEALKAAINGGDRATDTGVRAHNNVRLAVRSVTRRLSKGSMAERAFAEHLKTQLSTGLECLYSQSEGRVWE
jgi:hypothetical protein